MNDNSPFEFHALWGGPSGPNVVNLAHIMTSDMPDVFSCAELLANSLCMLKKIKEKNREHYQSLILDKDGANAAIETELKRLRSLDLEPSVSRALPQMPAYSFGVELDFKLAKPYLSRDDYAFYIIDNPVRKDKVFKVPCASAGSWKGVLRSACMMSFCTAAIKESAGKTGSSEKEFDGFLNSVIWPLRARTMLLFGNEKEAERNFVERIIYEKILPESLNGGKKPEIVKKRKEKWRESFTNYLVTSGYRTENIEGRMGRLYFFPTFFDRIGLEIINPHDRKTKTGKNPILMECVPAGATGKFRLLYVPFDFSGNLANGSGYVTPNESALKKQLSEDIPMVAHAVKTALTVQGFGAKTSSGFGTAEDDLPEPGQILINADLDISTAKSIRSKRLEARFRKGDNDSIADFIGPDYQLVSKEEYKTVLQSRDIQFTRKKNTLYNEAKRWWEDKGKALFEQQRLNLAAGLEDALSAAAFFKLSDFPDAAKQIREALNKGGEK